MEPDKETFWKDILATLKISVSDAIFSTWFKQTQLTNIKRSGDEFLVEIGCDSSYVKNYLEERYFQLVRDSLSASLKTPVSITFVVSQLPRAAEAALPTPLFDREARATNGSFLSALQKAKIRPNLTFQNYAVSSSNQMAHAAAEAVSKNPGSAYNPLFIWGGVGVGKTHLINAIAHSLIVRDVETHALISTAENFTNDIIEGIRNKTTPQVREKYRRLAIIIIDDIQFIAGKDTVQEEFFHTFNAVLASGGQIVLTSDRPPQEIPKLEDRLRSRFEAGLIVDIAPPDFELRCAIAQIKTKEKGLELSMQEIQLLAGNVDSARKIEGFLTQIISRHEINKETPFGVLIEEGLSKAGKGEDKEIKATPEDVIRVATKYFSLTKRALLGTSRVRPIARPRQILMYFLRHELGLPLAEVGRLIGNRDHTTVMHAVNKISHLASTDVQTREDIFGIKKALL